MNTELKLEEMKKVEEQEVIELEIKDIITIAIVIGVAGIVMSYTTQIQNNVASSFTVNSLPYNVSQYGMQGNLNLSAQLPTIGTIAGAAIIITILIRYFFVV